MLNTNYIGAVVKILEAPKKKIINSKTLVLRFRVQLAQLPYVRVVNLIVWGSSAHMLLNCYKVNDYILVEGYSSIKVTKTFQNRSLEKVTITAVNVYPF